MLESIVTFLQQLPPEGILFAAFVLTLVENIFPPSPSDVLLVFCGTMVGVDIVGFIPLLIFATMGSTIGFVIMYTIGARIGLKINERERIFFINVETIRKAEKWFRKYGTGLIIANRFLSGTRAVISFVAGASGINIIPATILSALSALLWNAILIVAGMKLGEHWREIGIYLEMYSTALIPALLGIVIILSAYWWYKKNQQ